MALLNAASSIWRRLTTRQPLEQRPAPKRYRIRKVNLAEGHCYIGEVRDSRFDTIWWMIDASGVKGSASSYFSDMHAGKYGCPDEAEAGRRINLYAHRQNDEVIWYG